MRSFILNTLQVLVMKLAFVSYPTAALLPPYHGSMGASIYALARELSKSCDVVVYGLADSQAGADSGTYEGADFRFLPSTAIDRATLKLRRAASKFRQLSMPLSTSGHLFPSFGRKVALDLAKGSFDVIHVQHCTQYIPEIRRLNPAAKIVLHIHAEWFSQSNFELISRRIRSVDLLLTVSHYVTEKTKRNFPQLADRCETLYNGVDLEEFNRQKDYEQARRGRVKRILFAGGVWPHKGPHILVEAFKLVLKSYPDITLDFVGPQGDYPLGEACDLKDQKAFDTMAPYFRVDRRGLLKAKLSRRSPKSYDYLEFLKASLGPERSRRVTFHGFVSRSRLVELYYESDLFVFPPIWNEAFGCTPLEAMAAGVPVVVSRCGGIVETVQDGKTGLIVEPNNPKALADAMLCLLTDDLKREQLGCQARQRAVKQFSWPQIASQMRSRYEALCQHPGPVRETQAAYPIFMADRL